MATVRIDDTKLPRFKRLVKDLVSRKMEQAGAKVVARARELAPVDTGALRNSISFTYNTETMTLQIHADVFYAYWQEVGNSRVPAHPYLRPALREIGPIFGSAINTDLQFQAPEKYTYSHTTSGRRAVSVRKFDHKVGFPLR
jgi:HK97 gp10 family phage protein